MSEHAVILMQGTSHAVYAELVLRRAGLTARLVPTPRHLSSDCGSAVLIRETDRPAAAAALDEAGVPIDRIEALER